MKKELYKSADDFLVSQICAILEDNNIPYIKRYDGAGSYLNISMGTSMNLKRILVGEEDYEKAIELISVLNSFNEEQK